MKKVLIVPFVFLQFCLFAQTGKEKWKLVKVRDGEKMYAADFKQNEFVIAIKEKKFSGYIGCNKFHGKLAYTKGDNIVPIKLVSTKMKCPDELTALEYATSEAINLSDRLVLNGSKAEFYNQSRLMAVLERLY